MFDLQSPTVKKAGKSKCNIPQQSNYRKSQSFIDVSHPGRNAFKQPDNVYDVSQSQKQWTAKFNKFVMRVPYRTTWVSAYIR